MSTIRSPAYPGKYEDRFLDCQEQLDAPLVDLVSAACQSGWTAQETLAAIIEVADNLMLAAEDTAEVNEILKRLR